MSTSLEELGLVPFLQKAVQAEVKRAMVEGASATERVMKPGKKRARTQAREQAMGRVMKPGKKRAKKRAMEQVMERVMEQVMEQVIVIKREVKRLIKRVIKREMKPLIQTLSPQGAPSTEWNVNARTSLDHQITRSEVKEYHLRFDNKLRSIIYTKDKIRDNDDGYVEIKLIDANNGEIEKVGRLSLIKIQIVVLGGDFGFEGQENWTKKQFKAKIVHQRGDKPLLKGKQNITLRDGVGSIDDLSFSVNSSWIKCKKFRLGARVLQSVGQVKIREAITEAFTVRDRRGKMLHLKKIKEDGKFHKALIDNNIRSGSDLKLMYKNDPGKLRMILKGCSKWEWDVIVHHGPRVLDDANSNPPISQEAEANNTATTGGPPFGSTGMQIDSNPASSSQYPAVNIQYPASQPPYMPILQSHDNAPWTLSNDSPGLYSLDPLDDFLSLDDNRQ